MAKTRPRSVPAQVLYEAHRALSEAATHPQDSPERLWLYKEFFLWLGAFEKYDRDRKANLLKAKQEDIARSPFGK